MGLLVQQVSEALMEQLDLLENLVVLVKVVHLATLAHLVRKETWEWKELKEAQVFKDQEENLGSLVSLDHQAKWGHQVNLVKMVRREVRDLWDHLVCQVSLVQEEKLAQQEVQGPLEPRVCQVHLVKLE